MASRASAMDKKKEYKKTARDEARTRRREEMNYYMEQMDKLRYDDAREQLSFPPTLDNVERKRLHNYARKIGLKTKSSGKDDGRFLTVFKKSVRPVIPTQHSNKAHLHLKPTTAEEISKFLDDFPVTKAEQEMNIDRKRDKNTHLDYGFGDARARTVLTVPPKVIGESKYAAARESLPTFEYRDAILSAIHFNQVVVVSGETGSGKTTQVPQYIMEHCTAADKECRIICTQPRRLAATSIATRVSQERNDTLGKTVGYQIRMDSRISPNSNLVFTTSGYLLRCLTGSSNNEVFKTITHLILDEVHEREKTTDFLLIAIRDAVKVNPHLKVILMSATIDSDLFSGYFDNCPVINVPGRLFDVDVKYLDDILHMMNYETGKMREYIKEAGLPKILRDAEDGDQVMAPIQQDIDAEQGIDIPNEEKEFFDECLDDCLNGDDESSFDQICYLISDENMPPDYVHSSTGRTPLGIAAEQGFDSAVNKLLAVGANPKHPDSSGKTPMDYAVANGHIFCVEIMQPFAEAVPVNKANENIQLVADNLAEAKLKAWKHLTLVAYQLTNKKPQDIDHELLFQLISFTHSTKPCDGSVLVFLPGYEDIMAQKELIETKARFSNYELFVLHSGVNGTNTAEQLRVFDAMPNGIRKIILATNIAETSITINDVVYVIDAGKVKQHTYDSVGSATCLRSVDISQACAKQRAGRAGRLRNGFSYRLYSTEQYEAMDAYTLPELLRVSLSEICLNARILAPDQMSIESFLLKALQPPALNNIRTSIDFLQKIDALDANERITQLGMHLANMPVDCQLGKAILYAVLLKCVDPVLTIVSALSVKDPFLLPLGEEGPQIAKLKKEFSEHALSDHRMLLRTFELWSQQRGAKQTYDFCKKNFICHGNMQMIQGVKRLILGHLNSTGILPNTVDRMQINANSKNWSLVKACLTAGIYPNICRVNEYTGGIWSRQDSKLMPHLSSVLRDRLSKSQLDPAVMASGAEWMIHGEKSRIARYSLIRDISCIPSIVLVLFTGSMTLKCSFDSIEDRVCRTAKDVDDDEDEDYEDEDDDDDEDDEYDDFDPEDEISRGIASMGFGLDENAEFDDDIYETELKIDDWISFSLESIDAELLFGLRQKFMAIVMRFLEKPAGFSLKHPETQTIYKIIDVIRREDHIEEELREIRSRQQAADYPYLSNHIRKDRAKRNASNMSNAPSTSNDVNSSNQWYGSQPAYMNEAYSTAVQTKQKKKKGRNGGNQHNQSYNAFERHSNPYVAKTHQYEAKPQQPSTSTQAEQQFIPNVYTSQPQAAQPARSRKPKLFSVPKTTPNTPSASTSYAQSALVNGLNTGEQSAKRYFIVGVESLRILKTIWKNRTNNWPFMMPMDTLQRVANERPPVKIVLFFHVKNAGTTFGYSELSFSNGRYSFKAKNSFAVGGGKEWFTQLKSPYTYAGDQELESYEGISFYSQCSKPTIV